MIGCVSFAVTSLWRLELNCSVVASCCVAGGCDCVKCLAGAGGGPAREGGSGAGASGERSAFGTYARGDARGESLSSFSAVISRCVGVVALSGSDEARTLGPLPLLLLWCNVPLLLLLLISCDRGRSLGVGRCQRRVRSKLFVYVACTPPAATVAAALTVLDGCTVGGYSCAAGGCTRCAAAAAEGGG